MKEFGARWKFPKSKKGKSNNSDQMVMVWKKRKPDKYDPVTAQKEDKKKKKKGKKND